MRFNRTLAFGIIGCLLAGLLIGASQATIKGGPDDSPMTIPVARIGDRVTYAHFERPNDMPKQEMSMSAEAGSVGGLFSGFLLDQSAAGGSASSNSPDGTELVLVGTHEAVRLDVAMDRTTERHDVLVFSSNHQVPGEGAEQDTDHTQLEYVDLATRLAIQSQFQMAIGAPFDWTLASRGFYISESRVPGLEFQGMTVQLGEDLTGDYIERLKILEAAGLAEFEADGADERVVSQSQRRWVADRAIVEGLDAYAIRTEHTIVAALSDEERDAFAQFFGQRPGSTLTATQRETAWVTQETAYPVLLESLLRMESGDVRITLQDQLMSLQESRPGGGTVVPWGHDRAIRHFRDANPNAARTTPGQLYPADGSGSRLGYPLSQAITDVQNDVRLAQFQLWRQQNPNNHLVSAELTPGERTTTAAQTSMWRLVYATPRGDAFEVSTERMQPAAPPLVESRGEKRVKSFDVADLPLQSATIATAERLWLDLAGDNYRDKTPNFVHWGMHVNQSSGAACLSRSWSMVETSAPVLRMLSVGYTNEGGCIQQPENHDESSLTIETDTGNLLHLFEWRIDWKRQPIGAFAKSYEPIQMSSKSTIDGIQPPDIQQAAVASTSLLAVFLALYFLPALKFVGAKGLLLIPGYAKLRKEELLDNKIRDQILQVVRNDPGVHTTDLAQRVDAGWGTTVYHLGVLEKNNLVSSLVDGRYHRFFPVGVVDFSMRGQLAVMKNARTKTIYELIAQDPGIVQEHLASRVGISAPAAIFHLKRLEEVGMVGRVKKGRKVHYFANEKPRIPAAADPKDSMEFA